MQTSLLSTAVITTCTLTSQSCLEIYKRFISKCKHLVSVLSWLVRPMSRSCVSLQL